MNRADTVIGSVVVILGAAALMIAVAFAAIIGAAAVTLASSYAFGDVFGRRPSLHHGFSKARAFHGSYAAMVMLAGAIVLIPGAPLGTITTAVQALAGVLLPSATVFLLLLCNCKAVLGPWTNPGWLNALASVIVIVGVLVILPATVLFPAIDVAMLTEILFGALAAGLACAGLYVRLGRTRSQLAVVAAGVPRKEWTMPALELLERPAWSPTRTIGITRSAATSSSPC